MKAEFWDQRYEEEQFAYGLTPNQFLVSAIEKFQQHGKATAPHTVKVLTLGEGEGRNALYMAKQGFKVTAVDYSSVGMAKLRGEATKAGLQDLIHTEVADLNDFDFRQNLDGAEGWDIIVSIFAHTPSPLKERIFAQVQATLKPNGWFVLTAYHPVNIGRGTGGPQDPDMCLTLDQMHAALPGWHFLRAEYLEKDVNEGKYHQGTASVIECIVSPTGSDSDEKK